MEVVVLAGCFAAIRAYGYKRIVRFDANGEVKRGVSEIEDVQAEMVRRVFT